MVNDLPRCPECKDAIVTEFGDTCGNCDEDDRSQMMLSELGTEEP